MIVNLTEQLKFFGYFLGVVHVNYAYFGAELGSSRAVLSDGLVCFSALTEVDCTYELNLRAVVENPKICQDSLN